MTRTGRQLEQEARDVVESLGGRWTGTSGMCRCPAHEDRNPSLSVRLGRSRLLFHCFAGCSASDILQALAASGLIGRSAPAEESHDTSSRMRDVSGSALRLWGSARPLTGSPGERYLERRDIGASSTELRYHPRTPHGPMPFTQFRPAMIAAVRDNAGLVAVHRTFLDLRTCGLAPFRPAKCALGRLGKGAVRLGGTGARLGLSEGIETALSVFILFGLPCWATLGTERFGQIDLPAGLTELILFPDHDAGGQRAERLARHAFPDVPLIQARYPSIPGADWNDVLTAGRIRAVVPSGGRAEPPRGLEPSR